MTDLDRYLDEFGDRLAGAQRARPLRRRRRPVLAAAAVVGIAAALPAVLPTTRQPLDPVAEAREALGRPGEIVYMKVTTELGDADPGRQADTVELWSATDPPRWRFVQTLHPGNGTMYDDQGPIRGRQEVSYADGEQRVYVAERDSLDVVRGFSDDGPAALVPTPFNLGSGDVQADLRTMLRDGEISDLGERQEDGRTVRRLVSEMPPGGQTLGRRLVYDVDPETFEPIQATLTVTPPRTPAVPMLTARMRVDAYDRIPIDETTEKLLEIETTPRTEVTVRHAGEMVPVPPPDPPREP